MTKSKDDQEFDVLLDFLKRSRGFDFSGYKHQSLMRRINKRMQTVNITGYLDYVDYLETHPGEFVELFNTVLINVTSFFRDEQPWEYLRDEIIPRLLSARQPDDPLRVWASGCASGEEVYTLAMLLAEAMGKESFLKRVKIYATDVDEDALQKARQASYSAVAMESVPPELREKYFNSNGNCYVFRPDFRRQIIFGRHDLVQDAPISRLDLIVCRNTLMYFNAEAQSKILSRLYFALNDKGFLFLGKAEMLLTHASLFMPVELKYRIFAKAPDTLGRDRHVVALAAAPQFNETASDIPIKEMSFDASLLAQIVVDAAGNLILSNKRARHMFGLALGDIGRPFADLEISYRPLELQPLLDQCFKDHRIVKSQRVEWRHASGDRQYLCVHLVPIVPVAGAAIGVSITFEDITSQEKSAEDLLQAKHELETSNEELQSAHEELETSNEELQSTNEELETTNEELQSTNEELETMNEELQSTNEELETMNEELRQMTMEANQGNVFLNSIISSVQAGLVVLDRDLNILVWNDQAVDLWGLRADEVRGHPFASLDIGLSVADLVAAAQSFIQNGARYMEVTLPAINRRGKTFNCLVKIGGIGANTAGTGSGVVLLMEEEK